MRAFFYPESVAVVGVSPAPDNLARAIVYHLVEFGFTGRIYLVGPRGGAFLGHRIYSSVEEIPDRVDIAVLLTPAPTLPALIHACGRKGIKRMIIESAGFRELGAERIELENQVQAAARAHGIRFIGPNCIGVMNKENGFCVPFMPFRDTFHLGPVACISQSGGVGGALLNALAAEHLGFSKFASIGNKLDVDENDLLAYLLEDEITQVIFIYLEGIAAGRRLMELAFEAPKPIIVHKANITAASADIASSHTAALAAADEVVSGALRQCGIIRVADSHATMTAIKGFLLPPVRGNRVAVLSRSGGHAVVAADAVASRGFELPPFPKEIVATVTAAMRAKVIRPGNPMDLGDLFDMQVFARLVEQTLARPGIDATLVVFNYNAVFFFIEENRALVRQIIDAANRYHKPLALCVLTSEEELRHLRQRHPGFPLFTDPVDAAAALACSRDFHRRQLADFGQAQVFPGARQRAADILAAAGASGHHRLSSSEAFELLRCYGIEVAPWVAAATAAEAVVAACELGFPVALKLGDRQLAHKTELGGVILGLDAAAAVTDAFQRLRAIQARALGPEAAGPIMVQRMIAAPFEAFVGAKHDDHFGPVVLAGLGGIEVEALGEVSVRVAPVAAATAEAMIEEVAGFRLLAPGRGRPPLDRPALVELIQRVSQLLCDLPQVVELDLNPVMVRPKGQGCVTVDAAVSIAAA